MVAFKLADMESKFADIIWDNAPINSTELVRLSKDIMKWEKSTTYTILKRLCDRGIFKNEGAVVSVLISREDFYASLSRRYIEDRFSGSLPMFLASYIGGKKLSAKQAAELVRLINEHKEG